MIDKTAREARALKAARRPFGEALIEFGLMPHFHDLSAETIDRIIEAAVTGYVDSMAAQAGVKARDGTVLEDDIPF